MDRGKNEHSESLLYISFLFIFYGLAQKTAKTLQYQGFSRLKKSVLIYKMGNL